MVGEITAVASEIIDVELKIVGYEKRKVHSWILSSQSHRASDLGAVCEHSLAFVSLTCIVFTTTWT